MSQPNNFAHLFTSNAVPHPLETASIQQVIDDYEAELTKLKSQLRAIRDKVRAHRALLSPVRRMPPEVLGEIFQLTIENCLEEDRKRSTTDLVLVCRAWYRAAQHTHRLWNVVSISRDFLPEMSFKKVAAWLGRSGSSPRTLTIRVQDEMRPCRCATDEAAGCSLNPHQGVVQLLTEGPSLNHLSIFCDNARCFQRLQDALAQGKEAQNRPWDSIKSFHLSISNKVWKNLADPASSIFDHIPKSVTSFTLELPCAHTAFSRTFWGGRSLKVPLPGPFLQGLTSFTIQCNWHGTQIFSALVDCVNVETLELDFNADASAPDLWPEDNPTIAQFTRTGLHLPRLRTLRLVEIPKDALKVMEVLHAPLLGKLEIRSPMSFSTSGFYEQLKACMQVWLQRDNVLHHLCLTDAGFFSDEILESLLKGFATITHLTIQAPRFTGLYGGLRARRDVFTALVGDDTLPKLEHLELLEMTYDNINFARLSSYLMNRSTREKLGEGCTAIKHLTLTYEEGEDPITISRLHKKAIEGLGDGKLARIDFGQKRGRIRRLY
ncbi:hypothetical protein MD484_g5695, partial [Candolleomyces efflorescens]